MLFKVVLNKEIRIFDPKDEPKFEDLISYIKVTFRQLPFKYQLFYLDEENDEITLKNDNDFKIMKKTAKKTVKVFIKEANEESEDSTQNIVLDFEEESEEFGEVRQQIENIDLEEKPERIEEVSEIELISENSFMNESLISIATSHINEHAIDEKMREMMPKFYEQVKRSIIKESSESKVEEEPSFDKVPFKIVHNNVVCDECLFENIEGIRYKCAVCADFDLCENCESVTTHDHPFLKIKNLSPYSINATTLNSYNEWMRNKNKLKKCQKKVKNIEEGLKKAKEQNKASESSFSEISVEVEEEPIKKMRIEENEIEIVEERVKSKQSNKVESEADIMSYKSDKSLRVNGIRDPLPPFLEKMFSVTLGPEKPRQNFNNQCLPNSLKGAKSEKKQKKCEKRLKKEQKKAKKLEEGLKQLEEGFKKVEEQKKASESSVPSPSVKVEEEPMKKMKIEENKVESEADIISNANYLCENLEFEYTNCYKFSQKNPGLTKEELLELYLNNKA